VIAGRIGDHAARPRGVVHRQQGVERATRLERTGDLQAFRLDPDRRAGHRVEPGIAQ
jgi:hypothetical protein